jgi:8-oxo-dGTP pyrophosphatase MutT (NUDIX family)
MIEPWPQIGSRPLGDFGVFTLRADRKVSPRTRQEDDFYVIDCVDWVNVVALTPEREVIMVEQFRHGTDTVELEIPGGMIDPGDGSPEAAAVRELREETGYEGENARRIGAVFPNPAIMTNTCFTVLVENCRLRHKVELDGAEDLETRLVPVAELPQLVAAGSIRHSLVVVALYRFELWQRGLRG